MGEYSPATVFSDRSARLETTLADMNEALASLRYLPDPDYNGFDELVVTVWDNGNSADVPNYALTDAGTFSANVTRADTTFGPLDGQVQLQQQVQDVFLRGVGNVVTNRIHITVLPANDKPYVRMNQTLQVTPRGGAFACASHLCPCCNVRGGV
jgi:asparagine N-glycosylation enzyme membrane subunit Stt3